ncbi:cilia- and flagella- associated protein 210 [Eucyclogobius newberryi]|uniref:cilia- and flagella- associated protein 210 n=1 Tax=Eucyclogobius newberryi TaxID=166745 RepID=UPI003B5C020B
MIPMPDLRKVTVLSKSESLRIQNQLKNVDREKERRMEEAKKREAMHLQSIEVVKLWSNTIAGQRQKNLEAKAIRQKIEEEKKLQFDIEEATYKAEKRKEAVERAKAQLFYQTDRVKGLHGAYLLSSVLKEREAQIELKQHIKNADNNVEKTFLEGAKARDDEAQRREEEKARQKKEESLTVVEELKNQMRKNELEREHMWKLKQEEGEEIQQLRELHLWEQRREQEQQKEERKLLMQARQEHLTNRQLEKVRSDQKEQMEEERRKLYISAKQKMTKLRRDKEKEIIRETQMQRERILEKIVNTQQEQAENEELKIARAIAEREAREAQLKFEEDERKAAMLESIAVHRESLRQENEQLKEKIKHKNEEMLRSKKEADQIYAEKQKHKAEKKKEELQSLQEFYRTQMVERGLKQQQQMQDMKQFEAMSTQIRAEEEYQFQLYAKDLISTAEEAKLNVVPLYKAAREGIGGGSGPAFNGVRPSYVVQDSSGAQMPNYVSDATLNVKSLSEDVNIEHAKKRLGFTW